MHNQKRDASALRKSNVGCSNKATTTQDKRGEREAAVGGVPGRWGNGGDRRPEQRERELSVTESERNVGFGGWGISISFSFLIILFFFFLER